jgi:hypothetical protein
VTAFTWAVLADATPVGEGFIKGALADLNAEKEAYLLEVFGNEAGVIAAAEFYELLEGPIETTFDDDGFHATQKFRIQRRQPLPRSTRISR